MPENRHLYLFPHSLFKIHPDNDPLLAEILGSDPEGTLVMFESGNVFTDATFRTRFGGVLDDWGIERDRLVILPYVTHDDYLRLNIHSEVMLDCLGWSGGNTSVDAVVAGLPIVTLPGRFMRSRQSEAMLRLIDVPELIAANHKEYVAMSVDVARDASRRHDLSRRMLDEASAIRPGRTGYRVDAPFARHGLRPVLKDRPLTESGAYRFLGLSSMSSIS